MRRLRLRVLCVCALIDFNWLAIFIERTERMVVCECDWLKVSRSFEQHGSLNLIATMPQAQITFSSKSVSFKRSSSECVYQWHTCITSRQTFSSANSSFSFLLHELTRLLVRSLAHFVHAYNFSTNDVPTFLWHSTTLCFGFNLLREYIVAAVVTLWK